ncbi:DUF1194 domain-containing protein [Pararhizobium antarcticum]|uniref:VWFA domain-containing protein n=1 Tax=Pararhizobium antarcticum TaxID=1798805 RepID=A0A657LW09_9HYPH|nr:DUF1194 domain-containing protein [Pararhizobium antarcticum]OJF93310.1 hypothetical protein AX761_20310 [Rhizobium sp. 58]OJF99611.1 hypothetical protein AX760_12360 [Pararhizobium antarcticum]
MFPTLALLLGLTAGTPVEAAATAAQEVDVELVLAVDMSGSMDLEEARIQRSGYVEAIRHPDFANAVTAGLLGRVAISYFEWAGSVNETSLVAWQVIETAADAAAFADRLAAQPVATRRGTSIANAISFGATLIRSNDFSGLRRVIDVSGDGPNNMGPPVSPARDAAVAQGLVVNGLAILIRPSGSTGGLDRYYADCVIGGAGSFVLPVRTPADFATAIRQKLVMEISGTGSSPRIVPVQIAPPTDCMIGEKLRPFYLDRVDPPSDK